MIYGLIEVTENKFLTLTQLQNKNYFVKGTDSSQFDEINVHKFYAIYGATNLGHIQLHYVISVHTFAC